MAPCSEADLLKTMPYVGRDSERSDGAGDWHRGSLPEAQHTWPAMPAWSHECTPVAATPAMGQVCGNVNRYLKWAFVEAANYHCDAPTTAGRIPTPSGCIKGSSANRTTPKAAVAVARHLAEAAYWILKKQQPYQRASQSFAGCSVLSSTHG